jgi:hypothetical protein
MPGGSLVLARRKTKQTGGHLMSTENYQTGAIYETEGQARLAFESLADLPLSQPVISLIEPDLSGADRQSVQAAQYDIRKQIKDALPGAGRGAGAGAGIGGIGAALLAAHSPALFVSAPILTGLAITAWSAWLGGAIGAGVALEMHKETLDAALDAASRSGHWCVLVHTRNADDHNRVLELLSSQLGAHVEECKHNHG